MVRLEEKEREREREREREQFKRYGSSSSFAVKTNQRNGQCWTNQTIIVTKKIPIQTFPINPFAMSTTCMYHVFGRRRFNGSDDIYDILDKMRIKRMYRWYNKKMRKQKKSNNSCNDKKNRT